VSVENVVVRDGVPALLVQYGPEPVPKWLAVVKKVNLRTSHTNSKIAKTLCKQSNRERENKALWCMNKNNACKSSTTLRQKPNESDNTRQEQRQRPKHLTTTRERSDKKYPRKTTAVEVDVG
jgi:hypothetical protein